MAHAAASVRLATPSFAQQVGDVDAGSLRADEQSVADLGVGEPAGEKPEHSEPKGWEIDGALV